MHKYHLLLYMLFVLTVSGQQENSNWFLNHGMWLDFNNDTPSILYNDHQDQISHILETTLSISDRDGQLLFYSDAFKIYNKNGEVLLGGDELIADYHGTQSMVAIPNIDNDQQYYIFSLSSTSGLEGRPVGELNYSILDMSLDSGLGGIIRHSKNITLTDSLTEHMLVAQGIEDELYLIVHKNSNNQFWAFPVDRDGIGEPIISETEQNFLMYGGNGTLKYNIDTDKIIMAGLPIIDITNGKTAYPSFVRLNNWDRCSGRISDIAIIDTASSLQYVHFDASFSEDGNKVYYTKGKELYQADLTKVPIDHNLVATFDDLEFSRFYLGPDGKIYFNCITKAQIFVIINPNDSYDQIVVDTFWTNPSNEISFGFPNVMIFPTTLEETDVSGIQLSETIREGRLSNVVLSLSISDREIESILWSNGSISDSILVDCNGVYWAEWFQNTCTLIRDSITISGIENSMLILELGDEEKCDRGLLTLSLNEGITMANSILWSTGDTTTSIAVDQPGIYTVEAVTEGCTVRDTIEVLEADDCPIDVNSCNTYLPNAISLSSMRGNDSFMPVSNCELQDYRLEIYDRWGGRIYQSTNPSSPWDGTSGDYEIQSGVYSYAIRYRYNQVDPITFHSGTVTVVR